MARKAKNCNTHKYDNRRSFDDKPVPAGKVLIPFRIDIFDLKKENYIDENCTTMRLGDFKYYIGFMAIDEALFSTYIKDFWDELNKDMAMRRDGRRIIGKNPDGSDKLCPFTRRCTGCLNKGLLKRRNPKRVQLLSLDYEYDGETFDIEDTTQPSVENQALDKLCPEPTEEKLKIKLLAHFDKETPATLRLSV